MAQNPQIQAFQSRFSNANIMKTKREKGTPNEFSQSRKNGTFRMPRRVWSIAIPSPRKSRPKIVSEKGPNLHFWISLKQLVGFF